MRVGIFGASGRIGQLLISLVRENPACSLSVIFLRKDSKISVACDCVKTDCLEEFIQLCDIVIDFSLPEASKTLFRALLKNPKPLVCGTTGLDGESFKLLDELAIQVPVLHATNMSFGVALLNQIVGLVAEKFRDADIEICEIHHRHKKDAPSGSALTLAETCAEARGLDLAQVRISGRDGEVGARTKDEIAVMSLRGGDVAGRHTVGFYADGEFLEFTHNATSRLTFAKGALKAAFWIFRQPKGRYKIADLFKYA